MRKGEVKWEVRIRHYQIFYKYLEEWFNWPREAQ